MGTTDQLNRRCPRLGGPVTYGYCRHHAEVSGPCWKILDCWWETFDVRAVLTRELGTEAVDRIEKAEPPAKTASLITLIRQAQERCAKD